MSSNGLLPDEKILFKNKEITQRVINKLGPVNDLIRIVEITEPIGNITYLKEKSKSKEIETVEFEPAFKLFNVETFNTSFKFKNEEILMLNDNHGIDTNESFELFIDTLIDEHVRIIMLKVFDKIKKLANDNIFDIKDSLWKKIIKFFYKIIGKNYDNRKFKVNNVKKIISKIFEASDRIAMKFKRGPATYLICSEGMAKLLLKDKIHNLSYGILENVGNIKELQIIVNKDMKYDDMSIYVGRKTMENEPGIYMPIMNTNDNIISYYLNEEKKELILSMKIRKCIINTEECEENIAKLDFELSGKLKKEFIKK